MNLCAPIREATPNYNSSFIRYHEMEFLSMHFCLLENDFPFFFGEMIFV